LNWVLFGIGAALLLGVANIPQKIAIGGISANTLSPFAYGMLTGIVIFVINLFFLLAYRDSFQLFAKKEWGFALLAGTLFALGSICIALGYRYGANASQFTSLFNTNTLIATVLGMLILKEALSVPTWQALLGAVFVVAGATLVTLKI
jgi:uncharacterized membrane protein